MSNQNQSNMFLSLENNKENVFADYKFGNFTMLITNIPQDCSVVLRAVKR